jgi:hypothetical protein
MTLQRWIIVVGVLVFAVFRPSMLRNVTLLSQGNPVTITLDSPLAGSVVSNTITLRATAGSSVAPISRVEFYCDGKLIGIVNSNNVPIPIPPTGFTVTGP